MLYLSPNTSGQTLYTTAYEGRQWLSEAFEQYLIVFYQNMGDTSYAFIGNVDSDNYRYTNFDIDTNDDDPTNGNILIPEEINGFFNYIIYGQNSTTNLDPLDSSVVGEVERGYLRILDPETAFNNDNTPTPTIGTYAG